ARDFDAVEFGPITQAEMNLLRGLRKVSSGRLDLTDHDLLAHVDSNQGADCIRVTSGGIGFPICLASLQFECDVVSLRKVVLEVVRGVVEIVGDDIELASIAKIGNRRTTGTAGRLS